MMSSKQMMVMMMMMMTMMMMMMMMMQQKPIAIEHSSLLRLEARDAKANSAARKLGQGLVSTVNAKPSS